MKMPRRVPQVGNQPPAFQMPVPQPPQFESSPMMPPAPQQFGGMPPQQAVVGNQSAAQAQQAQVEAQLQELALSIYLEIAPVAIREGNAARMKEYAKQAQQAAKDYFEVLGVTFE